MPQPLATSSSAPVSDVIAGGNASTSISSVPSRGLAGLGARMREAATDVLVVELGLSREHGRALLSLASACVLVAGVLMSVLAVKVQNDQLTRSIHLYERQAASAAATHRQLQLDLAARVSQPRLEAAAADMGLVPATVEPVLGARLP